MRCTLLTSLMFAAACGGGIDEPDQAKSGVSRKQDPSTADLPALVSGNSAFAAALYGQVHGTGNFVFSPYSISTALSMTYAGAAGSTATQMATALDFTLPVPKVFEAFDALDLALSEHAADGDVKLEVVSSLWYLTGAPVQPAFLDTLAENYGAGLYLTDFAKDPDGSREAINEWVSDRTHGKIAEVLAPDAIDASTRFAIANAIYFKADWATKFDPDDTSPAPFHAPGGDVAAKFMHVTEGASYGEGDGWRAASLSYHGDKLSMVIVVPDDLAAFEAGMTRTTFADVTSALTGMQLDVALPKFEFRTPIELGSALSALGMPAAFGSDADFSGIDGAHDLQLTRVVHQAFVLVDEDGTEAAASTVVIGDDSAELPPTPFAVDHPFVFFIRDTETNAILFMGRVVDPNAT